MSISIKILFLNVNGINSTDNKYSFRTLLKKFKVSEYDAMMIQEPRYKSSNFQQTYNWEKIAESLKITAKISHNEAGKGGVATFWKNKSITTKTAGVEIEDTI